MKQSHKSSYTTFEGLLNERCGEHAKEKINTSWFIIDFVFGWKSLTKWGRSIFANGSRRQKATMVSSDGTIIMFITNAHIVWTFFLHVQMLVRNTIVLMEVENDLQLFLKIFETLKPWPKSCAPLVMSPNHSLCINGSGHKSFGGLFHHFVEEKTNNKKGRVEMHVKQKCWMGQWPYELKEYTKNAKH